MIKYLILSTIVVTLLACKVELSPIVYGSDQCNYCKMNIVDNQHAAQYVTPKGKQFKFDAIECMVHKITEVGEENIAIMKVSNYSMPSSMIEAQSAFYIISPAIKSPMGANLSAVDSRIEANDLIMKHKGDVYDWNQLKKVIRK